MASVRRTTAIAAGTPGVFDDEDAPDLVPTGQVVLGRVKIIHKKTDKVAEAV